MTDDCHISDHDLERFILGMVKDETELAPMEEHLLACGQCAQRAEQTRQYIRIMRTALASLRTGRKV